MSEIEQYAAELLTI